MQLEALIEFPASLMVKEVQCTKYDGFREHCVQFVYDMFCHLHLLGELQSTSRRKHTAPIFYRVYHRIRDLQEFRGARHLWRCNPRQI